MLPFNHITFTLTVDLPIEHLSHIR